MRVNRISSIVILVLPALALVVLVQCDFVSGGPPRNLRIVAETDSTVRVAWSVPNEGVPSAYVVYFKEVNKSGFQPLGSTTDTTFVMDPGGVTGVYKVVSRYGGETFESEARLSTEPVFTDTLTLGELNAALKSGYGWLRGDGTGAAFDVKEQLSQGEVDLYVTDLKLGLAGPDYYLASPNLGPLDPGGGVPVAAWRVSKFTPALVYEDKPLPAYVPGAYSDKRAIGTVPSAYGCYTEDGYYALVKVMSCNTALGQVKVRTWFQSVRGLRLLKH